MIKKLEPTGDLCIKFTEEELERLNIKEGDTFSFKLQDDSVLLEKTVPLDIDLSEINRETLEFLISESCNKNISVSEVILDCLEKSIDHFERNENF
jgi:hypothetical protein